MKHFYSTNNADPDEMPHISSGSSLFTKVRPAGTFCVPRAYTKNTYIHIVIKVWRNLKAYIHNFYIDTLSKKISKMDFQF